LDFAEEFEAIVTSVVPASLEVFSIGSKNV